MCILLRDLESGTGVSSTFFGKEKITQDRCYQSGLSYLLTSLRSLFDRSIPNSAETLYLHYLSKFNTMTSVRIKQLSPLPSSVIFALLSLAMNVHQCQFLIARDARRFALVCFCTD